MIIAFLSSRCVAMTMKNLNCVSKLEQEQFFNSFDHVLCDVDGVLRYFNKPIFDAKEAIKLLRNLNKKIIYVSNNCIKSQEDYCKDLRSIGYDLNQTDLVLPVLAMIDYLKSNFDQNREIYVVGMTSVKCQLENAGFKIAEYAPDFVENSSEFVKWCTKRDDNVGAVIVDIDLNASHVKLQRAATHLRNPEVLFIVGGSERVLSIAGGTVIGPGSFQHIIQDITGRSAVSMAKPSLQLNNYIKKRFDLGDPRRVLFIGDSVLEDMGFASACGYQKLLVLSGATKEESLDNWSFPNHCKPDYYVQSLDDVANILRSNL